MNKDRDVDKLLSKHPVEFLLDWISDDRHKSKWHDNFGRTWNWEDPLRDTTDLAGLQAEVVKFCRDHGNAFPTTAKTSNTSTEETAMSFPEPWNTIVSNGWLDYFVAPCRYCTDQYFKADPTAQLTPEAPVWPVLNCSAAEPAPSVRCLRCYSRRFENDTAIPVKYAALVADWNLQHWPSSMLRGLWGDSASLVRGRLDGFMKAGPIAQQSIIVPAFRKLLRENFCLAWADVPPQDRLDDHGVVAAPGVSVEPLRFPAYRLQNPPHFGFCCMGADNQMLLSLQLNGDDVLTLYLPDRMTGKVEPVVVIKRWGETEVMSKWRKNLGELGQQFWRAVAHVYQALPLPVSAKQEAIILFCNLHKMTLAEFDRNYYARPGLTAQHDQGDLTGYGWEIVDILGKPER